MNYTLMAEDLRALLLHLQLKDCIVIGHSMGGKTAMTLAHIAPELVEKLVVIDIAPVNNPTHRHNNNFAGLFAVKEQAPQTRQEAKAILSEFVKDEAEQQFMLKAFDPKMPDSFRFNLTAIQANYANLMGWQPIFFEKPTLFIKGGASDYIQAKDTEAVLAQCPKLRYLLWRMLNTGFTQKSLKPLCEPFKNLLIRKNNESRYPFFYAN